jgi:hypothetical protein
MVDGTTARPFTVRTLPPPSATLSHRDRIIARARAHHSSIVRDPLADGDATLSSLLRDDVADEW